MTMTFDAENRLVTMTQGSGTTTFSYDATGNLTGENLLGSLTSYVYDNENRLSQLQNPDGTRSTYAYL